MHKMLLDEIVLVCKRIEAEGDNQISKSFSKEMLENCVIEQDRQLEAAKQRELELRAVIYAMIEVLVIVDDEYCYSNDDRVTDVLRMAEERRKK